MSSAKRDSLTSSFLIWMTLVSFSGLIPWLELPVQCWTEVVTIDILALFLILEGKPSVDVTIQQGVSCGLFTDAGWVPFYSQFAECLYHERALNFVRFTFCVSWDDCVLCVLHSINVAFYMDWFLGVEPTLHSWRQGRLIIVYNPPVLGQDTEMSSVDGNTCWVGILDMPGQTSVW